MKILIINGPNLNMLGQRDKAVYGEKTLEDIRREVSAFCAQQGIAADFYQSNIEGELVTVVQNAQADGYAGLVINAGAYTHYSHAIGDALGCITIPKIEVHISNVHAREDFRHISVLAGSCNGMICGLGADSYAMACLAIKRMLKA